MQISKLNHVCKQGLFPSPPQISHIATRSLLVSGASQALRVCIVLTVALCAPCRAPVQASNLTAATCSSPASDMVWSSSMMVVMLTSMVSVSVRPASCSCVDRSFKALIFLVMSLSCAEGSTCFWSSSNCSCDNFSTAPERRCLRDFGLVASCVASWIFFSKHFFGNHEVHGRLLSGNPATLLWRRELFSLFHRLSDGTCPRRRQQFTMLL